MKKTIKILSLMLIAAIMLASCGEKKLGDAVGMLNAVPVFITDERVDQNLEMTDDAIIVTIPNQGELIDKDGNLVNDVLIVNAFFQDLFNSNITSFALGDAMGTAKGGNPVEEFLSEAEKQNKVFLVEYKDKKYKLSPDLVRTILKSDKPVSLPPA